MSGASPKPPTIPQGEHATGDLRSVPRYSRRRFKKGVSSVKRSPAPPQDKNGREVLCGVKMGRITLVQRVASELANALICGLHLVVMSALAFTTAVYSIETSIELTAVEFRYVRLSNLLSSVD
jgi:hypothetical protein